MQLFPSSKISEIQQQFIGLLDKYREKHRHYHTIAHISTCLMLLDEVSDQLNDKKCIELVLWFHDIVYHPKKRNNESMSAKYARKILGNNGLNHSTLSKIEYLIEMTQHPSHPQTNDEKFLIDIDLSILGTDQAVYDTYKDWIRMEYSHVPSILYKHGRKKLLKCFLDEKNIYHTQYFQEKFEKQAIINMERELNQL